MRRKLLIVLPLLLTLACLGAPAVTEQPIAPTAGPDSEVPPASPTITPTDSSDLPGQIPGLKVVYILGGNLWFWSGSAPARQLTTDGDAAQVKLSDDGAVIVYQRGQSLWAINADGASPRQLVDVPNFTGRSFLGQFNFQPDTHIIYFVTYETVSAYGLPSNDLHRVDADSPAPQTLLTQGGGEFTFSPNGRLIALAQTERINVVNADGSGLVTALEFPLVKTYSDWSYIPQVVWLPDSTGFYTVIPASDIAADPAQKSRFLYVNAASPITAQLAEFNGASVRVSKPLISPDGSKVAYTVQNGTTLDVHVIDASTADMTVASHPNAGLIGLWAWSPDSEHFAYWMSDPALPLTAGPNLPSAPLVDSISPYSLTWVTADAFLYFRDGELRLGQIGNPVLTVIASGFPNYQEDTRYYDFSQ